MKVKFKSARGIALTVILLAVIVCAFIYAASNTAGSVSQKQLDGLSDAVMKAAIQCYAVEGFYPPTIEYLVDNYGLSVNEKKYLVSYDTFSPAAMPKIDVFQIN